MKDFKKYYLINATPDQVYLALTTETTLHLWTGEPAEMTPESGTEFSLWDGAISGKNLEFEPAKRIVQQWYFGEAETEPSIVTIKLHPDGATGTSMEIRHTNIPEEAYDDIVEGWTNIYAASLQEFYE